MNDNRLDRLLDGALGEYSRVSPREGLEQRILANLQSREEEGGWGWRWLWVVGPAVAAILLVAVFAVRQAPKHAADAANVTRQAQPAVITASSVSNTAPAAVSAGQVVRPRQRLRPCVVAKTDRSAEPRLATFPGPDGDDQQARMLLSFVTRHPEQAQDVLREEREFQQIASAAIARNSELGSERER